jgi:DNA-binding transcriptional ArsR family regulator
MDSETQNQTLLEFFKALAEPNRLKIVGFLAQRSYTVGELAEALGLGVSTTSNHLSTLAQVGLVSARPQGHYAVYSLDIAALQGMARRLLQTENLPRLSQQAENDTPAYDRKVLATFLDPQGRIIAFPAQEKKFLVLLRHVLQAFEPGERYAERQVNEILARYNDDTASLRRGLIESRLMRRERDGGAYWRTDEPGP